MAELALLASIVQIADVGLRLSSRLFLFGQTVATADRSIVAISKDVKLTSYVLQHLGQTFKDDKNFIHSRKATETAEEVAQECSNVFEEMDTILLKKLSHLKDESSTEKKARGKILLERLKWPTLKGKMDLLSCNLDRLKSTLTLMLEVLNYAQKVAKRNARPAALAEQAQLIEVLAQVKKEREDLYVQAQRGLECLSIDGNKETVSDSLAPVPMGMNLMAMPKDPPKSNHGLMNSTQASDLAHQPTPNNPLGINQLIAEYTRLRKSLIQEVQSEQYGIQQGSRERLRTRIDDAHDFEIQCIESTPQEVRKYRTPLSKRNRISIDKSTFSADNLSSSGKEETNGAPTPSSPRANEETNGQDNYRRFGRGTRGCRRSDPAQEDIPTTTSEETIAGSRLTPPSDTPPSSSPVQHALSSCPKAKEESRAPTGGGRPRMRNMNRRLRRAGVIKDPTSSLSRGSQVFDLNVTSDSLEHMGIEPIVRPQISAEEHQHPPPITESNSEMPMGSEIAASSANNPTNYSVSHVAGNSHTAPNDDLEDPKSHVTGDEHGASATATGNTRDTAEGPSAGTNPDHPARKSGFHAPSKDDESQRIMEKLERELFGETEFSAEMGTLDDPETLGAQKRAGNQATKNTRKRRRLYDEEVEVSRETVAKDDPVKERSKELVADVQPDVETRVVELDRLLAEWTTL